MAQPKDFTLRVGESAKVKSGMFESIYVVYAGMLAADTYSVAVKWVSGYNAAAYNLYLKTGQKEIQLEKGRIVVSSVSGDRFSFRYYPSLRYLPTL